MPFFLTHAANVEYEFLIEPKGLTRPLVKQIHANTIIEVDKNNFDSLCKNPPEADGLITRAPGLSLSIFTADCIPLLIFTDHIPMTIAALHCGWRGAKANILRQALAQIGGTPHSMHVIFGPSIMACCFEVKEDLVQSFKAAGHHPEPYLRYQNEKMFFNLSEFLIREQLQKLALENIHTENLRCTHCTTPRLPSYRRDKATDPRMRSWIRIGPS